MLRLVLQRMTAQRRIAEQLERVSLDEVLRRMQSSSLTNPARSLEAHFVLAAEDCEDGSQPAAAACAESPADASPGDPLRHALSERLLAEVRRDIRAPAITLDDCGLMLANCLRHGLSPAATQQIFALWRRCMDSAAAVPAAPTSPRSSISMLGIGRGGGSGAVSQLEQFQSLVRVAEACIDAHEGHQRDHRRSPREPSSALPTAATSSRACSIAFTLGDWAALVDVVEQHWTLFVDHGTSTTGLLVQFVALALVQTGHASVAEAAPEPGGGFVKGLRRLGHLQTDRALLQQRLFSLCDTAIAALCADETASAAKTEEEEEARSPRRDHPWWYHPQELVRLSRAVRMVESYEQQQQQQQPGRSVGGHSGGVALPSRPGAPRRPESGGARPPKREAGVVGRTTSGSARSAVPRRPHTASATSASSSSSSVARWLPRLSATWWPASAPPPAPGLGAGQRRGDGGVRPGRRLGAYVTHHALRQHASEVAPRRPITPPPPMPSYAVSPALTTLSLLDVEEIFSTVCATAATSVSPSADAVTAFSWWVRDVLFHQHGQRSLVDGREMAGLLGIAEVCVAYPDGTQTVLAEALKCVQRSALFLWSAVVPADVKASGLAWSRACAVVADALPLTTVRAEAQRALLALTQASGQPTPLAAAAAETSDAERVQRQVRYGLLLLACLQLQMPNGALSPAVMGTLRQLVLAAPFRRDDADHGGLAAVVRALFVFTRPPPAPPRPSATTADVLTLEPAVPCLLNALTKLLSSASVDEVGSGSGGGATPPLQHLTSAERQLLRTALQDVRLQAQCEARDGAMLLSSVVALCSGDEVAPSLKTMRTASVQVPRLSLATAAARLSPVGAVDAQAALFPITDSTAADARDAAGRWGAEPLDRTPRRLLHASEEHLLLQAELDAVTRRLRQRRQPS